jgi:hypothetical protein
VATEAAEVEEEVVILETMEVHLVPKQDQTKAMAGHRAASVPA